MKEKLYVLTYNGTLEGFSGEGCGGKYSLVNACPTCGTGAKLIGNLPVKKIKGSKAFFETLSRDYLIVSELYHNLKLLNIKIGELLPIVDYKTNKEQTYYNFKSDFYFPKMRPDSSGIVTEKQCPICMRDGFFDDHIIGAPLIPRIYKYNYVEIEELLTKSDIFNTWEHFGRSNLVAEGIKVIRYARPSLLVKENVRKVFEDLKIKKAVFEEVTFV